MSFLGFQAADIDGWVQDVNLFVERGTIFFETLFIYF